MVTTSIDSESLGGFSSQKILPGNPRGAAIPQVKLSETDPGDRLNIVVANNFLCKRDSFSQETLAA